MGSEADGHSGYSHAAAGVAEHSVMFPWAVQEASRGLAVSEDSAQKRELNLAPMGVPA
jgi:hypothetical protein